MHDSLLVYVCIQYVQIHCIAANIDIVQYINFEILAYIYLASWLPNSETGTFSVRKCICPWFIYSAYVLGLYMVM